MNKVVVGILFLLIFSATNNAQQISKPVFFPAVNTFSLTDVQQQKTTLINTAGESLKLFVFISPECPLCQNYSKVLDSIQQQYKQQMDVYGIVPGSAYDLKDIVAFQKKYHTSFSFYIDEKMALTKYFQATVTPQVILLSNSMQLLYNGAIDDWAISVGKKRPKASQHYLADAIEQSLHNTPVLIATTKPVGCKINDY